MSRSERRKKEGRNYLNSIFYTSSSELLFCNRNIHISKLMHWNFHAGVDSYSSTHPAITIPLAAQLDSANKTELKAVPFFYSILPGMEAEISTHNLSHCSQEMKCIVSCGCCIYFIALHWITFPRQ